MDRVIDDDERYIYVTAVSYYKLATVGRAN